MQKNNVYATFVSIYDEYPHRSIQVLCLGDQLAQAFVVLALAFSGETFANIIFCCK